jgi:hypothetical protein
MASDPVQSYGIGFGPGKGGTPQIAVAQGGRRGVAISSPLPCVDAEQLGSLAGSQVIHSPVKVSLLGRATCNRQ